MKLDSSSKIHLECMFENQPQLVKDLHNLNKLEPHLDRKYQQALNLAAKFRDQGQSAEEAFQNASDLILAPSDGPALSEATTHRSRYRWTIRRRSTRNSNGGRRSWIC
jgi:hypothetical protein